MKRHRCCEAESPRARAQTQQIPASAAAAAATSARRLPRLRERSDQPLGPRKTMSAPQCDGKLAPLRLRLCGLRTRAPKEASCPARGFAPQRHDSSYREGCHLRECSVYVDLQERCLIRKQNGQFGRANPPKLTSLSSPSRAGLRDQIGQPVLPLRAHVYTHRAICTVTMSR